MGMCAYVLKANFFALALRRGNFLDNFWASSRHQLDPQRAHFWLRYQLNSGDAVATQLVDRCIAEPLELARARLPVPIDGSQRGV